MRYTKSEEAMKVAETLMPGGVNSPVRAFKSVDTPAIFMDHGKGSKIYDIDGNEYIDYVLSWGPLKLLVIYMKQLIKVQVLVHQHYLKINWRSSLLTEYLQ